MQMFEIDFGAVGNARKALPCFVLRTQHLRRALFAGVALTLFVGTAQAQENQAPAGVSSAESAGAYADEIIVTARRRAESLQNVPVAITAFDEGFLERQNVRDIADLAAYTPGLQVAEGSGGSGGIIYLRGVGSTGAFPLIEQAVVFNLDGVQISTGQILRATELDVEQVEVLRGPQALFFGKNSPGGVISFRTADPGNRFEARVRAGYEFNANEFTTEAMVSGPLSDTVGARLAVAYSAMDGFLRIRSIDATTPFGTANPTQSGRAPDSEQVFARGTLTYRNGPFDARFKLTYIFSNNNYGNGFLQQRVFCSLGVPQILPGVPYPANAAIDDCRADGVTVGGNLSPAFFNADPLIGDDPSGFRRNTQWLASLEMNYDISDNIRLTSVSGYYNADEPQNSQFTFQPIADLVYSVNTTNIEQASQELRLATDFDFPVNLLVGGFYEYSRKQALTGAIFAGTFVGPEDFIQRSDAWSIFAQAGVDITPQLRFSAGARYSEDSKSAEVFVARQRLLGLTQDQISFSDFSPEFTLSYEPNQNLLLFASYKEAFKAGGFDAGLGTGGRLRANPTLGFAYAPERAEGFEGGIRGRFDGGRGRFSLIGYRYEYSDLQYSAFDPATLGLRVTNAAAATIQGLELDFSWRPRAITGLSLRASIGFNDTQFDEFRAGCYSGQTIELGCNLDQAPNGAFSSQDLTGQSLSYAPRWSGSLGLLYERDAGALTLGFSGDMFFSSGYFASLEQAPGSRQDGYATFDLAFRINDRNRLWEVAFIGSNLTNEYALGRAVNVSLTGTNTGRPGPSVLGDVASTVSRGRQFLVQVTRRFGS